MTQVDVLCDRCKKVVSGVFGHGYTGGFYDLSDRIWSFLARPGERFLCDKCAQSDPKYKEQYANTWR